MTPTTSSIWAMSISIFFCATLVLLDPVRSFLLRRQPFLTITIDQTVLTTKTVAPVCYEFAQDFSICGRKARQYEVEPFDDSLFHLYSTAMENNFYVYYQENYIQPSFEQSLGRGKSIFFFNGLGGFVVTKLTSAISATVLVTSGLTETVTIGCLNPEETVPENLCAKNPCIPNPCTKNGDKSALCKVEGVTSYSCECSGDFFTNGISCIGQQQSPVNIDTAKAIEKNLQPLRLTNYDSDLSELTVQNTGKTAQSTVKTAGREKITISGAGLGSTYEFEQFHFHWNLDTMEGSEHTIDGRGYPVEIHLVHRNTKYSSVQDALTQPDGLAVIGVVFELAPDDNPFFEEFYSTFSSITEAESDFTLTDPATLLIDFLPEDISRFYRYRGSLTTPPFNEVVDWIVMDDTLRLSEAQINKFGELLDSEGSSIRFNDREVQPIKDREIYRRSGKKYSTRDWFMLLQNKSG